MVIATGAASAQPSQAEEATGALPWPASASVAHLKVKGTAIVASFANSSSTMAAITRSLRSARSAGQMYGHRCTSVETSAPRSLETRAAGLPEDSLLVIRLPAMVEPQTGPDG